MRIDDLTSLYTDTETYDYVEVDTSGYINFIYQMVKDATMDERSVKTSADRQAKTQAIIFFKSDNPEIAKWREYVMDVALGWEDFEQKRKIILEVIDSGIRWVEIKKFAEIGKLGQPHKEDKEKAKLKNGITERTTDIQTED